MHLKPTTARRLYLAACVILVLAVLGGLYYLNHLTPWVADDFGKATGCAALTSFSSWWQNFCAFYLHWGGRVWGEQMILVLLALPDTTADALNALAYVVMVLLACANIGGGRWSFAGRFLFVNFCMLAFLPAFGQDFLWISGSANYLWASLLPLALLALCRRQDAASMTWLAHPVAWVGVFVLGVFAGWMNENVSVALLWILAGFAVHARLQSDHLPGWVAAALAGTACGAALLWCAPGNFARFAAEQHPTALASIIGKVFSNGMRLLQYDSGLLPAIVIVLLLLYGRSGRKWLAALYASGAFVSAFALAAATTLHNRIFLGPILMLTIAAGILLTDAIAGAEGRTLRCLLVAFCLLGLVSLGSEAKRGVADYHQAWQAAVQTIEAERARGHLDVTIDPLFPPNRFCAAYDLGRIAPREKNHAGLNRSIAGHFGLRTIQTVRAADVPAQQP
ncbi:DUF6056 family protein [Selenomonas sp.]|uniref:DUF6056 family protein n=1 Tax=Selenomonas sp. TaxID=2053611 RepID=UPI0025DA4A7A|nr:DUF6056 family protein [Selenomonas sp.]MCI6086641.1 DUF6056 family protein [Selenomonas sp.]MDY3297428.1 DUF6056 family protein [Selenomonas sp.]MDY4415043.1 DUF6056 family protein [Selenomonas sp.]